MSIGQARRTANTPVREATTVAKVTKRGKKYTVAVALRQRTYLQTCLLYTSPSPRDS